MSNSQKPLRPLLPKWPVTHGGLFARTDAFMGAATGGVTVMPDAPFSPHLPPRRKDVGIMTEPDARIEPVTRTMGDTRLEEEEERGEEERMVEEPGRVKRGQHGPWIPLPRRAAILALHWYAGKTWTEISTFLRVTPDTARGIVNRAKVKSRVANFCNC
jgi:hypothetical protein